MTHTNPPSPPSQPLKAYRLIGVPLALLGLVYLVGPEPGLFGFGTTGSPLYWVTGLSLLGLGGVLSTVSWWWRG